MRDSDKTFVTTIRTTAQRAATLLRWLRSRGVEPRSKNELLELVLTHAVGQIAKQEPNLVVESIEEALVLLGASGLTSKRNRKTILLALQDESCSDNGPSVFNEGEAQRALAQMLANEED